MSDMTSEQFAQRVSDFGLAERRAIDQAINELGAGEHSLEDTIKVFQARGLVTKIGRAHV